MIPPPERHARTYITGFMGSGMSTVGPLLAAALGHEFIDLDAVIEAKEGESIPVIFRRRGETDFRSLERRELLLLSSRSGIVVATGGGALTDPGSMAIVHESGMLVYLEVSLETLLARLRGKSGRPMIAADDGSPLDDVHLRDRVASLLREREPAYRQADVIVDSGSVAPAETVSLILKSLRSLSFHA
jgi:shikimate kinase